MSNGPKILLEKITPTLDNFTLNEVAEFAAKVLSVSEFRLNGDILTHFMKGLTPEEGMFLIDYLGRKGYLFTKKRRK